MKLIAELLKITEKKETKRNELNEIKGEPGTAA